MGFIDRAGQRISIVFSIAAMLLAGSAWSANPSPKSVKPKADHPKALIVLAHASKVQYGDFRGTSDVNYFLTQAYPAKAALKEIQSKLTTDGWSAQDEDALNPGLPSSIKRGWTEHGEGEQTVRQWLADWKNAAGDVVRFQLSYKSKDKGTAKLRQLHVIAIYTPSAIYQQQLQELSKTNGR